ncbi:tape measure protein [Hymenobacter sp. YC55]|uniref:tape measure protein n=1 Tax=Hymenobacter sp. YC55 TaxID=3034019 RepID=UPI0023F8BC03|nr:tape measure protein [Hymenobacter sp. YC55]MDF7810518.1 hypothetical protein [Hymenobacter sp. YC55]
MADDKQKREVEIVIKGQQANASLKEMGAASAVMNAQLSKMGTDDPGRAKLLQDFQELNGRIAETRQQMRQLIPTQQQQAAEQEKLRKAAEEERLETERLQAAQEQLTRERVEAIAQGKQQTASLKEMKTAASLLEVELTSMSKDDPGRAALLRDFTVLQQRIAAARTEMNTYVKTAEELAAEEAALAAATEKHNREQIQVVVNGKKVAATYNEMDAAAKQLEKQLKDLSADDPGRKKLLADYQALQQRIEGVRLEMGQTAEKSSFFTKALAFTGIGLGVDAIVDGVMSVGKEILETTAKYEKYEAVLKNALGSQEKAAKAMSDIETMAAKTPFSVDELTDSYIKFVNRGINPSMTEMGKMADIAASQGKSFDQLTEAVLDAGSGEFERLKEFGIKASKAGDEVSLSFKGVNQTVKNTPEAINGAIMAFGAMQGVAGSTAAISATLEGQMSNLGDQSDQLEKKIGNGLKPVFTAIISVFGVLMGWFTRLLDNLGPVGDLFNAIGQEVKGLYEEIRDIIEGLGLFDSKTDTVKIAVEALTAVLTVLTFGLRTTIGIARGLADGFVYLYNKSEIVRGVLGGLAAVVTTTFKTIKDDALKYLGGVGDLIVGVFTLDTEKIKAGLKATFDATEDVVFKSGMRNAKAFVDGYHANKDNKITRTVTVDTKTTGGAPAAPGEAAPVSGSSGPSAAELEKQRKEAEKHRKQELAEQKKHDQERLNATKDWVKENGDLLKTRNALSAQLDQTGMDDELQRRASQRQKLFDEALEKANKLTGQEVDYTEQLAAIMEERDLRLRELATKFAEEEQQRKQKALDEKIEQNQAETDEKVAQLQVDLENGVLTQQAYDDAVWEAKRAGMERELALVKERSGAESAEYRKAHAQQLKDLAEHIKQTKGQKDGLAKFEDSLQKVRKIMDSDELAFIMDNIDKKSGAYKAYKAIRKTLALADLGINLAKELSAIAEAAAENPLNGVTAGAAGAVQLVVQSGLAVGRATMAGIQIAKYAQGGPTNRVQEIATTREALAMLSGASGGSQAPGGSFQAGGPVDKATIGLIGEAGPELVIPNWLYADPKQADLMGFLEASIASKGRAFAEGGSTVPGATMGRATAAGDDSITGLLGQMVQVMGKLNDRLEGVEEWQSNLTVHNNLQEVERGLRVVQQTREGGGIR